MNDLDYTRLARTDSVYRMSARRRPSNVGRALVWAAIVFLALTILFAAIRPALGATDGPFVHRHRVCMKRSIIISGGSPQISMCVKRGYR